MYKLDPQEIKETTIEETIYNHRPIKKNDNLL